ncbi:MAG TPA: tautomerase family protein [Roseomonas sp.]|jgi:phenylpyruvate tautomerase PptA (4-oxalocrotonate tautomerase family)
MPLARIDLLKGKDAAYRQAIGRVVYEAMIGVGVPEQDRFQIIHEHDAENFLFDPTYLGMQRSQDLIMIQITWNDGRSVDQKKTLYKSILDGLVAAIGIRPDDLLINLIEVRKENWSFGNGIATYAD